jgi:hypothetical protein
VKKYSKSNEKVFALGTTPHIYYLANRLPAGNLFVFQFPWFMINTEERILKGLENDPPALIIRDSSSNVSDMNLIKYMPRIDRYVSDNFKVVDSLNDVDILLPDK